MLDHAIVVGGISRTQDLLIVAVDTLWLNGGLDGAVPYGSVSLNSVSFMMWSFFEMRKAPLGSSGASLLVLFLLPISEYQRAPRAAKRKAKKKVVIVKLRAHGFSFKTARSISLSISGFKRKSANWHLGGFT